MTDDADAATDADVAAAADYDEDDEDELRAAIALSMQAADSNEGGDAGGANDDDAGVTKAGGLDGDSNPAGENPSAVAATAAGTTTNAAATATETKTMKNSAAATTATEAFDRRAFHSLMWDDAATTANDRERWIHERIATPAMGRKTNPNFAGGKGGDDGDEKNEKSDGKDDLLTPLEAFTGHSDRSDDPQKPSSSSSSSPPQRWWGLTQKHGGPCGVLAAIQAEMIRVLVFGRTNDKNKLSYPFSPFDNDVCGGRLGPVGGSEAEGALAMAIGMILARAAIMPPASDNDDVGGGGKHPSASVQLVLPDHGGERDSKAASGEEKSQDSTSWMNQMPNLKVHAITVATAATTTKDKISDTDASPEMKRPRNNGSKGVTFAEQSETDGATPSLAAEQTRMTALARAVLKFLLLEGEGEGEGRERDRGDAAGGAEDGGGSDSRLGAIRPLERFQGPGGVMFLVMSLVQTRGVDRIRRDMDDPSTTITSQFGHSSQELMNLLLTGQAVSNVFDNSMALSEDLSCHGVQRRPAVGYLTVLESLRYCEVGDYYKSPLFPIWVVGSTSHFSVLFGDERCLQESKSDKLLERCRRAFKKVEGGGENGFILADKLVKVVEELDLKAQVGGDGGVQTLQAYLEVSGAGIILWDDFWKASSRLMTGSSLESVMSGPEDLMQVDGDNGMNVDGPPLLITQFAEAGDDSTTRPPPTLPQQQSDEELAKKLAAEWGSMPAEESQFAKSDEDYARELQAQWDAEERGQSASDGADVVDLSSQAATTDDVATLASEQEQRPPSPLSETQREASDEEAKEGGKVAAAAGSEAGGDEDRMSMLRHQRLEFEKHGTTFPLYHYNGLRRHGSLEDGGTLTPFRLTRLSAAEAVGVSIALSSRGGSGHGGGNGYLEDVVRTKWPSSMLNWFGKSPPSID